MATGSFILTGSRRKVGSLVTYSRGGKQVIRALASSVANPRSVAQSRRRCFFAPAAKFYSPLATVLETSVQGKNRSQSYSAFLKKAIEDAANNGWYIPKGLGFFPMPYRLSKGTIQPMVYAFNSAENWIQTNYQPAAEPTTMGELSQIFIEMGYEPGMQITLIFICTDQDFSVPTNRDYYGANYWIRSMYFIIAPESTDTIASALPGLQINLDDEICFSLANTNLIGGAIIASKFENDAWKRSTQRLSINTNLENFLSNIDNVNASVASYGYSTSVVESAVYLNQSAANSGQINAATVALSDGSAVTLQSISYDNGVALVRAARSSSVYQDVNVKIGADYLLTASTKGALPDGATATTNYLDGTDTAVQQWLQENGVAASVF